MKAIGIDIGTTTVSVIMVDCNSGDIIDNITMEHKAFLKGHVPESKIQDPEKLVRIAKYALCSLSDKYGSPAVIGLTGQMHGMLYVNENGDAVSPLYTWQDGCGNLVQDDGQSYAEKLKETGGAAATGFGLVTHFYLQKNNRIPKDAVKMVTISDYVGMKLCKRKEPVIAKDMAASWGCFDLKRGAFFKERLENLGLDISYIPELFENHSVIGYTEGDVPKGIPVIASLGDNQASVLGSVQNVQDTVLVNVGTGSQVSVGIDRYYECGNSIELRPYIENMSLMVGSSLCGGRAYAMLEKFYREISDSKTSMYERMEEQARDFLLTKGDVWQVKTTFSGTRSNPQERGSISGIGVDNFCPGAMTVGIINGILEELYGMYQKMYEKTGKEAKYLVGSGNGIRRNKLMQELAEEIFGMKMQIPVCQEEAAYGAALHAMAVVGSVQNVKEAQKKIKYFD